jgi:hypothetical protein
LFCNNRAKLSGPGTLNTDTFLRECKQHLAKRYADIYLSKLQRFAGSRHLQVLFGKTEKVSGYKTQPVIFNSFDDVVKEFGAEKADKIKTKLKKDNEGRLHYIIKQRVVKSEEISYKVYIGLWILTLFFHPKAANLERRIAIDDAIKRFKESFLVDVLPYSEKKLRNIVLSLVEAQKAEGIVPEIFSIDETDGVIFVSSRQIEIFFESFEADDIYGEIKEYVDQLTIHNHIRKRYRITLDSYKTSASRVVGVE